jgi:DNA mismatch repair ATPase MutL
MSAKTSSTFNCTLAAKLPTIGGSTPLNITSTIPLDKTVTDTLTRRVKLPPKTIGTPKGVEILPSSIDNVEFFCIKITNPVSDEIPSEAKVFECYFDFATPSTNSSSQNDASHGKPQNQTSSSSSYSSAAERSNPTTSTTSSPDKSRRSGKSYSTDKDSSSSYDKEGGTSYDEESNSDSALKTSLEDKTASYNLPQTSSSSSSAGQPKMIGFRNDVFIIGSDIIQKVGKINKLGFTNHLDDEQELHIIIGYHADQ